MIRLSHTSARLSIAFAMPMLILGVVDARSGEPTQGASVEGITEYVYENGLRLLLFPDRSNQQVTVNITYFVGSRHEGRGETGMAHLLEHMVFKGTPTHQDIWRLIEDHGGSFNGTTWVDRTNYYETLPTVDKGNLEFAIALEADRMINSLIAAEDLETEMTVVRNEFEMGENNPISILSERMMSTAYLWHNYGKSTIGSRSDIERVPVENLRAFYKKNYQPDNAMLVVAGDFDPKRALELVTKYFGVIPRPRRQLTATYTIEPPQDGPRHVDLRRVGDIGAVGSIYHVSAGSHPDYPAIQVIGRLLSDEPSGRLYKALVETKLATSVRHYAHAWAEPGVIETIVEIGADQDPGPVLEKMNHVMESLGSSDLTDEEVERAKNAILKNIDMSFKSSRRIAIGLTEWAACGDWRLFFLHRDRVEKLTTEEVRRVARYYLTSGNRTTGVFHPLKTPENRTVAPETPNVLALVRDYKGRKAISTGESFDPTPSNIESRVVRTQLPNGMKLAILPRETRGDSVRAMITLRYGSEEAIVGRVETVKMIGDMMMRGTKNRSYQQIRDELDRLKARVSVSSGTMMGPPGALNVSIETDREHFGEVVGLVGDILKEPSFPTDELEVLKRDQVSRLEEQLSDPQALAFKSVSRGLNPVSSDSIHYVPTIAESIEQMKSVNLDGLRDFHREYIGANDAEMTVIGDVDASEVKTVVGRIFGGWKASKPFKRIVSPYQSGVKGSDTVIETPDKKMAMVCAAINIRMSDTDPDYPAMTLVNYIFGSSTKSRLLNRLRQKEGLSYSAFSFFFADSLDANGVFFGGAICAPENADKAYASLLDEFSILVRGGIGPEELADAKKSYRLKTKNRLASDARVARMLNSGLYLDRTMAYYEDLYEKIDAVTPEQIKRMLEKNIQVDRLVKVRAGDLKAANSVD